MADIKEVLKKLGLEETAIADEKILVDDVVKDFNTKQQAHYFELFRNELGEKDLTADKLKTYSVDQKSKYFGEAIANLDRNLKKAGLNLSDDDLKKMKLSEKIEKFEEAMKEKYSSNKDVKELQTKLLESENGKAKIIEDAEAKVKQAFIEADSKLMKDRTDIGLKNKFLSVPKEKIIGNKHRDGYLLALKSTLETKYDLAIDESGDIIAYIKGSQQRATETKDGKQFFITAEELILAGLDDLGFLQKSNGKDDDKKDDKKDDQQKVIDLNKDVKDKIHTGTDHSAVSERTQQMKEAFEKNKQAA